MSRAALLCAAACLLAAGLLSGARSPTWPDEQAKSSQLDETWPSGRVWPSQFGADAESSAKMERDSWASSWSGGGGGGGPEIAPDFLPADKRSQLADEPSARRPRPQHEFIYVIAPVSEQALPFEQAKFEQGYKSLVSLAAPTYKTGLQKIVAPPESSRAGKLVRLAHLNGLNVGPEPAGDQCRAARAPVKLARDEFHAATGQLVRQCAGLVELNSCQGQCVSSVTPSVKSPGGLVKTCACCSEGSFRRVEVRLTDCRLAGGAGQSAPPGHMDVQVDEPMDCKCRLCE